MPCWFLRLAGHQKAEPQSYPECTRGEGDKRAAKARLLVLGSDALVDTFPKPDICIDIPRIQEDFHIWG